MHERFDIRIAWAPIAWLIVGQLLLPAIGVAHAHEREHRPDAAGRWSVHRHGAGVPHGHSPAPARDRHPDEDGFREISDPVATLRYAGSEQAVALTETAVPPEASSIKGSGSGSAAPVAVVPCGSWQSGGAASASPRALRLNACRWSAHLLRGPPTVA